MFRVESCAFSSDERQVFVEDDAGTVYMWDAETGYQVQQLKKHRDDIPSPDITSDNGLRLSPEADGTVPIYDTQTGDEHPFRLHRFLDGEWATLRTDGSGAVVVSPGAWRWLSWRFINPTTGQVDALPAEAFGPLPVCEREA